MSEKIYGIVSVVVASAAVGLAYYLGRKDNEKSSKFREKWAFSKGLLFASMREAENVYSVLKRSSSDREIDRISKENYTAMKEYLEQNDLWDEYRAMYPEEDD